MRRLVSPLITPIRTSAHRKSENDNLRDEYSSLSEDVPKDVAFARIALQKQADAVNMWIGNERSITSMHKDNYEVSLLTSGVLT